MLPRSFVLCGACVSATGRRSFVLPRSCLVVRGPATLPLVASEREGLGPWGCPRSLSSLGHTVRPRRVGLRPLLHRSLRAARLVVGGRAPVRLACNAPGSFLSAYGFCCLRTGLLPASDTCLQTGLHSIRPRAVASRFALAHCETARHAARSGGIESLSARFCINIKGAQKLLRSTSRGEHYWGSKAELQQHSRPPQHAVVARRASYTSQRSCAVPASVG